MKILVANLGSTSFKYRLFDMAEEKQLARGGIERIGSPESKCFVEIGAWRQDLVAQVPDAGMNRGAFKASQEPPELFPYPSRAAFNEEMTWMLWRIAKLKP